MNHVKGLAQQFQEAQKKQAGANGNGQGDPKAAAQVESIMLTAKAKADVLKANAGLKMQHKDQQFQADQKRKDAQTGAEIKRSGVRTRHELLANRLKALDE